MTEARTRARANILESLEIHPVSAPEYQKLLVDDEDDRPFLKDAEQSGVPKLQRSLCKLADDERAARRAQLNEVYERLGSAIVSELKLIEEAWLQEGRAAEEGERLANALADVLQATKEEYSRRAGAFREFLKETVQAKIEALVLEARQVAEEEVNDYLMQLQGAHWATLRAAVRRGGTFYGSVAINLPDDISGYFQEPMAAVWGQKLLRDIRKRTTELAEDIQQMVSELCVWAQEHGGASVNKKLLDAQQERIAALTRQMQAVGKEAVAELRETVKNDLTAVIRKPIRAACEQFVKEGDDIGPGVKYRVLALFRKLSNKATSAAREPAIEILTANFKDVRKEIQEAFQSGGDPLQDTADLIVDSHTARIKRSDAQRRGPILDGLKSLFASCPVPLAAPPKSAS